MLAHPDRRGAGAALGADTIALLDGVEVWNRKHDKIAPSGMALELQRSAEHLDAFVGLDFHTAKQLFPLNTLVVQDRARGAPGTFDALRRGQYAPRPLGLSHELALDAQTTKTILEPLEAMRRRLFRRLRRRGVAM